MVKLSGDPSRHGVEGEVTSQKRGHYLKTKKARKAYLGSFPLNIRENRDKKEVMKNEEWMSR